MDVRLERERVIAHRLRAQHLADRLPASRAPAALVCGIQDSPPGSALLALHARVREVTADGFDAALGGSRSIVRTWTMRGAPFVIPTADLGVFTAGVLPPTERALRRFIPGIEYSADRLGLTVRETVDLVEPAVTAVLAGRALPIVELGAEAAAVVGTELSPERVAVWREEGPHAAGQPIGEAVVHFCLRILALRRRVCFAPRTGDAAPFVLVTDWMGDVSEPDPATARAELLRRYLHCYGPSTRADFAAWLGVGAGDTDAWWDPIEPELTRVEFGGPAWLLAADLDALAAAEPMTGVRLLPPGDPYTGLRDRGTVVDPEHRRAVWRTVGAPGTVVLDGEIVGTWRPRKTGRRLTVTVDCFGDPPERDRRRITAEAQTLGPLRGATTVTVDLTP